jgi:hypothetical protein
VRQPESKLWERVSAVMFGRWFADRIETGKTTQGVPDVFFVFESQKVNGWIELKTIPRWPKRDETPVRIAHFTRQQKRWLRNKARAGVNCWFLLYVEFGHYYVLIHGSQAHNVGSWTRADLILNASAVWRDNIDANLLTSVLIGE